MWSDEYFQMMEADSTAPPERTALPSELKAKIQFEDDSDDFEPPKPKTARQQAKQQAMRAKQKKTSETKGRKRNEVASETKGNKQQVSQKKKTTTKASAVETVQEKGTTVKTAQESQEDGQQTSPLDETERSLARAQWRGD
jgi:hypothetical protein